MSSKTPYRSAVIGAGKISEEHLRFLTTSPAATADAVCELSPALGEYAAEMFGVERAYTDYREMLQDRNPDVVHILTPPHTHRQLVTDCIDSGAHVIVEKPIATSNAEFHDLWSMAQSKGVALIEDHNYRFNEPVLAIEKLIEAGELGDIEEVEVRMALGIRGGGRYADANLPHPSHKLPAGVLHEFITHLTYLTLRFLPTFDRVGAAWSNHAGGELFKYDDLDALVIGGSTHARIRFSARTKPDCFCLTVRGSRGWAETDLFQPHLRVVTPRPGGEQLSPLANQLINGVALAGSSVKGFLNKVRQKTPYEGLGTFLDLAYASLDGASDPPVTFDDMDRATRLIEALLAEENQV